MNGVTPRGDPPFSRRRRRQVSFVAVVVGLLLLSFVALSGFGCDGGGLAVAAPFWPGGSVCFDVPVVGFGVLCLLSGLVGLHDT